MTIVRYRKCSDRLKRLDANKAAGPDLKEAADQIAEPIAVMFGMSLTSTVLPSDWKQANIKLNFQKGKRTKPVIITLEVLLLLYARSLRAS